MVKLLKKVKKKPIYVNLTRSHYSSNPPLGIRIIGKHWSKKHTLSRIYLFAIYLKSIYVPLLYSSNKR